MYYSEKICTYLIIAVILVAVELIYFKAADHFNIIDKPNERSSHSTIVLRGGGIIFAISILVWMGLQMVHGSWLMINDYWPFIVGLVLIAGVSFIDDIHSLPDSVRLVAQFAAMILMIWNIGLFSVESLGSRVESQILSFGLMGLVVVAALVVCVGAMNIINFMDGINGITAGYAIAVITPLIIINNKYEIINNKPFIDQSWLMVALIGVLVFSFFNFRQKGKAKCFAGDVGSIGIAFIMLFAIGRLIMQTGDVTWLLLLMVYGVDGCLTICHRIMLHENLGQAHRKHAYQLMANELGMSHVAVSIIYMVMQLAISLIAIYVVPDTIVAHWIYLIVVAVIMGVAYILFMKKYYHLHEEYLASLNANAHK